MFDKKPMKPVIIYRKQMKKPKLALPSKRISVLRLISFEDVDSSHVRFAIEFNAGE